MTSDIVAMASLSWLTGSTLMALVPVVVLLVGLDVYALRDLHRVGSVRYLPKPVWALVIVLVSAPLGALVYLAIGRSHDDEPPASGDGTLRREGTRRS